MTKDTDGYLVLNFFTKSYLQGGWMSKNTDGYLVLKYFTRVLPTGWMDE